MPEYIDPVINLDNHSELGGDELGLSWSSLKRTAAKIAKKATPILAASGTVAMVVPGGQAYGAAALTAAGTLKAVGAAAGMGDKKSKKKYAAVRAEYSAARKKKDTLGIRKFGKQYKELRSGLVQYAKVKGNPELQKKLYRQFLSNVKKTRAIKETRLHPPVLKRTRKQIAQVKAGQEKRRQLESGGGTAAQQQRFQRYKSRVREAASTAVGLKVDRGKKPKRGTWTVTNRGPVEYVVTKSGNIIKNRFK